MEKGLEGFLLGLVAAVVNLGGLWMAIRMFTDPRTLPGPKQDLRPQTMLVVVACFVKMPIFIAAGYLSWRIGTPAPQCFIAAVFLVYSALILRVAKTR
jgi:hypothetical protein